jgi:hypothetical protein
MQAQLTREQQEIAGQRELLLKQLDHTAHIAPPQAAGSPSQPITAAGSPPPAGSQAPDGPKLATGTTTDQFKKMRRDAKRRAIGV